MSQETIHEVSFEKKLESLLNRTCQENASDTPDFILAKYLVGCLNAFNAATKEREAWYGRGTQPSSGIPVVEASPSPAP